VDAIHVESRAIFAQVVNATLVAGFAQSASMFNALESPISEAALTTWDEPEITHTTQLWNTYCLIRISVQYHGRTAVPMASAGADTPWSSLRPIKPYSSR